MCGTDESPDTLRTARPADDASRPPPDNTSPHPTHETSRPPLVRPPLTRLAGLLCRSRAGLLATATLGRRLGGVAGLSALVGALPAAPAGAADPQPYTVELAPTGEDGLDAALHASSTLIALRESAPVGPFALITRARTDRERLTAALGSFGHYSGSVGITIAGHKLDDPALPELLGRAEGPVTVAIGVTTGPLYHLRKVELTGTHDPAALSEARAALTVKPGDPALAAPVVAGQAAMLSSLMQHGRALAKVETPQATLVPAERALDVAYRIDPGPRVDLGPIRVQGLRRMNESFVRRRLTVHQGEPFDPRTIEDARTDLSGLGVFGSVSATAADRLDEAGQIPITFTVVERPLRVVGANVAYSTDLGASAGVTWQHRNLFGNAENLQLGAAVTNMGGSASDGLGYDLNAALTFPDTFVRNQSITISLRGVKEQLDAYDRTAVLGGVSSSYRLGPRWTLSGGVAAQQSHITQEGRTRDYTLLQLPLSARYDSTGASGLLEPTGGIRATLSATPTASLAGRSADFFILQATGSTYFDLSGGGRSVLALRATIASIQGASAFGVPPDQRLYAGGSATVRGYKYQSIGPLFPDRRPMGGASLGAATVEFRQRIGRSFGAAIFADAGQVDSGSRPFAGRLRAGAGAGVRYYTSFAPIRADIAVPLDRRSGDDAFEVYIGLGQAF